MKKLLVLTDYPIGFGSGFGETLSNLLGGFPEEKLWNAYPAHLRGEPRKARGRAFPIHSAQRPAAWPRSLKLLYWPLLKMRQHTDSRSAFRVLARLVAREMIEALLTCPVSPWLLDVSLRLKREFSGLCLLFFVMDDWEGHHRCYGLPFTARRRQMLSEAIRCSDARFAVSEEMAARYGDEFGVSWQVLHNGLDLQALPGPMAAPPAPFRRILLAGDVNVFRVDAILGFARGLELYNQEASIPAQLEIMGTISGDCLAQLAAFPCVVLLPRLQHAECLKAQAKADLLYLPMAFARGTERIAALSLPTKLPEYLAAGRPIFFHAPEGSAVLRFAERWDLSPWLSSLSPEAVRDTLASLATSGAACNPELARRALRKEFDLPVLRGKLYRALA